MFKISKKARRLSTEEKTQYKKDGYLTGLPVFSSGAKDDLNNFTEKSFQKHVNVNLKAPALLIQSFKKIDR